MLKEFSSANILQETIRFGIGGHDGKLEEGTESGVDWEVLGDFVYFFDCRSDFVQNISWNWYVKSLAAYVENGGTFWHQDIASSSNIK